MIPKHGVGLQRSLPRSPECFTGTISNLLYEKHFMEA